MNKEAAKEQYLQNKVEELEAICREKGMRLTQQRIEIFKVVAQSCSHPDAETVYEAVKQKMPTVSVDTVYRTLASLEELNMIFRVDNQLPKARFDADKTPHHHFLCVKCNEVYDVFLEDGEQIPIPKNASKFGEVKDLNLQIRGICTKCLNNQNTGECKH